jgi:hypothetical protein
MKKARALIVIALAVVVAIVVVRSAFVAAYASRDPAKAAAIWSSHPSVIFATGLEEVGRTAAVGKPVGKAEVDRLLTASTKAPLAPEPFLVRGVEAQTEGKEALAALAFLEARHHDPRSVAARYFLADHYLKTGQSRLGLGEISTMARLVPQSLSGIAPYLAAYARSPGAEPEVKNMLRQHPDLEPWLLEALAADPGNTRLALSLWSGRSGDGARAWQQRLLNALVAAGHYDEAQAAWSRFSLGAKREGGLVDPKFTSSGLPPFSWSLASGPAGVAEPDGGGRLHILYYGRDDLILAGQLLMLRPGSYRLSMLVGGSAPSARSIAWTIRCLPAAVEIAEIGLGGAGKGGALAGTFTIPPSGCAAQRLELAGAAPELPEQSDLTISELRLQPAGGQ